MFKTILIANRGEIACRVIRTARAMGCQTVAVYSEADRDALHVRMADQAVLIGAAPSAQSYLRADVILQAMAQTDAEAVHPGYGFLSENAAFAEQVEKEGRVFIGPRPKAIAAMGDKVRSKEIASKSGVNVIEGKIAVLESSDQAVTMSRDIGYPVMLKAAAGGGGKGMRVARDDDDVRRAFRSAASEAKSSFGDERLFIEKFIENPRHIEIQIIADSHGNIVYLGERECSIQRRHQKVIEEAPSPFIDAKTRARMGEQAVLLAKAVDYVGVGTVEFIVDEKKNFYFLEMNTRLQVEHPVTEMVTRCDLVEEMIKVAAGQKLPWKQKDITVRGWAMEARIYAEDPQRNFLPSIGRLVSYRAPIKGNQPSTPLRIDTGVEEGSEISMHYDPMIAKLCAFGTSRIQAVDRMAEALDRFHVRGISHNIPFLSDVMQHPRFRKGVFSTAFLDEEYAEGYVPSSFRESNRLWFFAAAAFVHRVVVTAQVSIEGQLAGHEARVPSQWVLCAASQRIPVTITPDEKYSQKIDAKGDKKKSERIDAKGGWQVECAGEKFSMSARWKPGQYEMSCTIGDATRYFQVERKGSGYRLIHQGSIFDVLLLRPREVELYALMPERKAVDMSRYLLSPMPGLLISVAVKEGQKICAGEELAVVEAMKMENVLRAERDGVIEAIETQAGDSLVVDQKILRFEKEE